LTNQEPIRFPATTILCFFLTLFAVPVLGQDSREQEKTIALAADSLVVDSLSIVPGTLRITLWRKGMAELADSTMYSVDYFTATVYWKLSPRPDSVTLQYRTFPYDFGRTYFHKDPAALEQADLNLTPYEVPAAPTYDFSELEQLQYNGSLVRGISFGNNQDVVVNSSFNLQMSGKLQNDVEISAAITDNNIPIQPEGNTQQLQEFDRVFIRLAKDEHALTVGDYDLLRPQSYFINYYKRAQGASYTGTYQLGNAGSLKSSVHAAVARGVYMRQFLNVIEGNQGPYKLRGNNGETFIIILAGTERVWLDGVLLTRGAENDYIIDYNAGEITFTPKQLVNKDKRIQVEFEYADNSYFRSIIAQNNTFTSADEKWKVRLNVYSEQDSRNQPLDQELDSLSIARLRSVGDSVQQAFIPGFDTLSYDPDRIMYRLTDSLGFDTVFVYSTDPESAGYVLTFTELGANKGNYVLSSNLANGRIYKWVQPLGGVPQGTAEPVLLLKTPISRQLITAGVDYAINQQQTVGMEVAFSNNDINTFSDIDNADNDGLGLQGHYASNKKFENGWTLSSQTTYEFISETFKFIERYRPVEFNRDWNILSTEPSNEHYGQTAWSLRGKEHWSLDASSSVFVREALYRGFRQGLNYRLNNNAWRIQTGGSWVSAATDSTRSDFIRPDITIAKKIQQWKGTEAGIRYWSEHNYTRKDDSLVTSSFFFDEYIAFIKTSDTAVNQLSSEWILRNDGLPNAGIMNLANQGFTWNLSGALNKNASNRLSWLLTYRTLEVRDTSLSLLQNENSLLGRLQHTYVASKGWLTSDIFLEVGTGQEPRREFTFVEVEPGQGTHTWFDYNNNGIQELNEFEIAVFADQATFIQVFIPTDEYIQANVSQFNYVLGLNPKAVWFDRKGLRSGLSRFSSLSTLQLNRKVLDDGTLLTYLPLGEVADSQLVSSNIYWQNTIYFNRAEPIFGADYTYLSTIGRIVLVNGPETRDKSEHRLTLRYKIADPLIVNLIGTLGNKGLASDAFTDRTYQTPYSIWEPRLTYIKDATFRISLSYVNRAANNSEGAESLQSQSAVLDFRYNVPGNSTIGSRFSYTQVAFEGQEDSPVGFAMLEGLQNGNNILWNINFDKRLSQVLQMTISYDGRKTGSAAIVHIGRVQMRALF
jgi:hypothetical protein